ncbi:hypothetical protein GOV11_03285 [Candidatus Woesearchaeota archaeon]|nr:hypothetical protein [Candidatus Woesearchaeota archaeon]
MGFVPTIPEEEVRHAVSSIDEVFTVEDVADKLNLSDCDYQDEGSLLWGIICMQNKGELEQLFRVQSHTGLGILGDYNSLNDIPDIYYDEFYGGMVYFSVKNVDVYWKKS